MATLQTSAKSLALVFITVTCLQAQPYAGGYVYQPSTAGESHARGMADLVRSAGVNNLLNSEAAGNLEEARSKNLDNRLKYTETYFKQKQMNREYRRAQQGPRPSPEALYRSSRAMMPDRPDASELDPVYGRIKWPPYLTQQQFSSYRTKLDELFAKRAEGNATYETGEEITQAADAMAEQLRKAAKGSITNATIDASKFIQSLKFETRFSPG